MSDKWFGIIVSFLVGVFVGVAVMGLYLNQHNKPIVIKKMKYDLINGRPVNTTLDSLECELLKLNIEKTKRNVIFQYEIKR